MSFADYAPAQHHDRRSAAERIDRRRHRGSDDRPGINIGNRQFQGTGCGSAISGPGDRTGPPHLGL
jgi:hypothetical protein